MKYKNIIIILKLNWMISEKNGEGIFRNYRMNYFIKFDLYINILKTVNTFCAQNHFLMVDVRRY